MPKSSWRGSSLSRKEEEQMDEVERELKELERRISRIKERL